MKKLLYPLSFALTAFLILYSCSAEEEDNTPPSIIIQTPEPKPPAPTQYTLEVTAGEGGTVSTEGGTYDEGTEVTITATPAEGYEFVGWEGNDSDSSSLTITLNSSINVQALFEQVSISDLFSEKSFYIDKLLVTQPSILAFDSNDTYQETDFFSIVKKGWLGLTMEESHNGGFYGTGQIDPDYFYVEFMFVLKDDLNNDGLEDMVFSFSVGPHTIDSNQSGIPFFALINLGDGTFDFSQEYFSQDFVRTPMTAYKSEVADFNGDGINDFILGMRGLSRISQADGSTNSSASAPILALSRGDNFYDNSENLNGIHIGTISSENDLDLNGIADFISDRAIASGDFDNDGDIDLFVTEKILLNDGDGNFSISSEQLRDVFMPRKLDPSFFEKPYEAHSNDFNNDGFYDIIIAPNGDFITRNGGSGWVAMSNGTSNFSEWDKVPLPNPRYENNSNLNDFESNDIDNDGYVDLIIATTRRNPYYRGAGIQILKNNSGDGFIDITESNIDDQSMFDQWWGEGELILEDFNNDSVLDIIHLTTNNSDGPPNEHHGTNIYINNNGFFNIYDTENKIPFTSWTQFDGYSNFFDDPNIDHTATLDRAYPVNINNDGLIDFISLDQEGGPPGNPLTKVFYSIISK